MDIIFGLDFGTTNSLISLVDRGTLLSLVNEQTEAPHPSMVIVKGEEVIVGQTAKEQPMMLKIMRPVIQLEVPKFTLAKMIIIFRFQ